MGWIDPAKEKAFVNTEWTRVSQNLMVTYWIAAQMAISQEGLSSIEFYRYARLLKIAS
jgi:hypothetical protein